jgi:glycosyl transferase family 25
MLPNGWKCVVINLARSTARLQSIANQLTAARIPFDRFEALDGGLIDPDRYPNFDQKLYEKRHGKAPTANEIACFMSHIGVMRAFLASDAKRCLVLEDDAVFEPDLANIVREPDHAAEDWDIALLYGNHSGAPCTLRKLGSQHQLVGFFFRQTRAVAYVINRKAAEAYIDNLLPMSLPIDVDFDRTWDFDIRFRGVLPFPVQTGRHSSEIGKPGRKFAWYRRLDTYACRTRCELQRLYHYTVTDPIWLQAITHQLSTHSDNAPPTLPESRPPPFAAPSPTACPVMTLTDYRST